MIWETKESGVCKKGINKYISIKIPTSRIFKKTPIFDKRRREEAQKSVQQQYERERLEYERNRQLEAERRRREIEEEEKKRKGLLGKLFS